MAAAAQNLGAHSVRPSLPESFVESYGYGIRTPQFSAYVNSLGMKEITCFVGEPSSAHRDQTYYPGCGESSKLFAHLYEPIWNSDGSVNANNYYAIYMYKLLQAYGDKVRFWEVVNEPDFTTNQADQNAWLTRAPNPGELANIQAPFFNYIRMLRIAYEVVHKYRPEAYVTTGGVGYSQFMDALLRYTDNPNGGTVTGEYPNTGGAYLDALSFHSYPAFALHYWDVSIANFRYTRTSDYAANQMLKDKQDMANVLAKYGYGTTYPAKSLLMTETNIARRTAGDRTGSDEMQRNFGIKALVLAQKNNIKQLYFYQLGESVNAPSANQTVSDADEIALMGLYENLGRDSPGSQKATLLGQAFATTSKLLYNYQYDAARTAALALPSTADGVAFRNNNGQYAYVLWAKALTDNSEYANASYSFPAGWNLASAQRYEWNYAVSPGATATVAPQNIALTATPVFFTETAGAVATAPAPAPTPAPAPAPAPSTSGCAGTGSLLREQWDNVSGNTVGAVPTGSAPSSSAAITQFESPAQSGTNYGARLRGYLCVPQSGAYTFWIAADDAAELYLSTSDQPTAKVRIAACSGWTASNRDFTRYPGQQSASVQLVAGQRYYVEALHKQSWGPGYVSVAWLRPDGVRQEPIPGSALVPFGATSAPTTSTPAPTPAPSTSGACTGTGSLLREQWANVSGTNLADIPLGATPSSSAAITQFESPAQSGTNYGARLRGYLCVPQSGAYTFWIAGDDQAELYLSTNDQPASAQRIASCTSWTSWVHDFSRSSSQQSAPVQLVAGQRYYVEARHKQSWGPGYVSVAWLRPDGVRQEPIPGSALVPFGATGAAQASSASALLTDATSTDVAGRSEVTVFPNPFSTQTGRASVQVRVAKSGPATLALYDMQGRLVRRLFAGTLDAGAARTVSLEAAGLSDGLYLVRLVTSSEVINKKVMCTK